MKWIWIFSFLSNPLFAKEIPLTLEYAKTEEARIYGLMQRESLPKDHGMLFVYPEKTKIQIWMFNCLIDLSLAFLDENGVILSLHELKAYPKLTFKDENETFKFFLDKSVTSKIPALYALEMNKGWFKEHDVQKGDSLKTDMIDQHSLIITNP